MARKPVTQEIDENMEQDLLRFAFDDLWDGARGSGVFLNKDECLRLLRKLKISSVPLSTPQWQEIAWYYLRYEAGHKEDGTEAAVTFTAQKFGVSRSEVFDARRRWREYKAAWKS